MTVLSISSTQQIEQADVLVLEEEPDEQLRGKLSNDVINERVFLPQESSIS